MMDTKRAMVIGGLVVLAVGAWVLVNYLRSQQVDPVVVQQLQWKIVDQGLDDDTGSSTSRVYITVAGVDVEVGGYRGTCGLINGSSTPLLSGEVSGVICIRNSTGKEVGIFNEGGKLVLKEGDVEFNADGTFARRENFQTREGI